MIHLKPTITLRAALFLVCLLSAEALAGINTTQLEIGSSTVWDLTYYNFTLNASTAQNMTNLTIIFPAGFVVSSASIGNTSGNLSNGTTFIIGQNVSYYFDPLQIEAYTNITFKANGVRNANASGTHSLMVLTFNGTGDENNTGNATVDFSLTPAHTSEVQAVFTTQLPTAGSNFSANLSSRDRFGNPTNDTYDFTSDDSLAILPPNGTSNGTEINFTLKTAGTMGITVRSATNATISNVTHFNVSAAQAASVRVFFSSKVFTAGHNFSGNFSSFDAFGNAVNDTYNFSSSDSNSTLPENGSVNGTDYNFSLGTGGSSTITVFSGSNNSASNATTFEVNNMTVHNITVVYSALSSVANGTIYANITSYDANGNPLTDAYVATSSDGRAVLPASGFSNGTNITFILKTAGTITITITSMGNSSATNATPILVNVSSVSQVLLSPLAQSITTAQTQQFTATLVDAFGNTNSTVTATFNSTGSISTSGLFSPSAAGTYYVAASYSSIWNTTTITVSTPTATPTATAEDNSGSTGNTQTNPTYTPPVYQPRSTPTPAAATPAPTSKKTLAIQETPTPDPYKASAEAEIKSAQEAINEAKGKGLDTAEAEKLLQTAVGYATSGEYQKAFSSAQQAKGRANQLVLAAAKAASVPEELSVIDNKGGVKWPLIFLIVIIIGAGVYSYVHFAEKQREKFRKRHAEAAAKAKDEAEESEGKDEEEGDEKKGKGGKHKGEIDIAL